MIGFSITESRTFSWCRSCRWHCGTSFDSLVYFCVFCFWGFLVFVGFFLSWNDCSKQGGLESVTESSDETFPPFLTNCPSDILLWRVTIFFPLLIVVVLAHLAGDSWKMEVCSQTLRTLLQHPESRSFYSRNLDVCYYVQEFEFSCPLLVCYYLELFS